jgi:hypothetical protein
MTMDRLRTLAFYSGIAVALALVAAGILGGRAGVIAVALYLGAILVPGLLLWAVLAARFSSHRRGVVETAVYSNVLGLGLVIAVGWTLARFGAFEVAAVLGVELVLTSLLVALNWKPLQRAIGSLRLRSVTWDWSEVAYLVGVVAVGLALLLPVLLIQTSGYLVADDTATFASVANQLLHTGSWNTALKLFPNLPSGPNNVQFDNPGLLVLYALFAGATGVNAIYLAAPLYLLPTVLSTLAMYLLLRRFSASPILCFALPILWLLGCETSNTLFYNNLTDALYYGIIPDAIFSLVGYLVALGLLIDLGRGSDRAWYEVGVLSAAFLVVVQMDQLTFLMLVLAVLGFGTWILWRRGWRWNLLRLAVVVVPTLVTLPPYLLPSILSSRSPALYGQSSIGPHTFLLVYWDQIPRTIGALGLVLAVIAGAGVLLVVARRGAFRPRSRRFDDTAIVVVLVLLSLISFYLTFSNVGTDLLGISSSRFLEYAGMTMVPLAVVPLDRALALPRKSRVGRRAVSAVLVAVVLVVGAASAGATLSIVPATTDSNNLFTPSMMEAAIWLSDHAPPNVTIVADGMGGNQAIIPIGAFVPNPFFDRPQFTLAGAVAAPPIGSAGNPYFVLNQVMEYPSFANAETAWTNFSMEYYVYQIGYSDSEIGAFSHLPYFALVYSNAQVDIFQFVGGAGPGFISATAYASASSGLTTLYSGKAYSWAYGLPEVPNEVGSLYPNGSALDGSSITYNVSAAIGGNYSLLVHRHVVQTAEYLDVLANGVLQGQIYFASQGPTFGTELNLTLQAGANTVTLVLEGTVGYMDPIDYLVVAPAAT